MGVVSRHERKLRQAMKRVGEAGACDLAPKGIIVARLTNMNFIDRMVIVSLTASRYMSSVVEI